MRARSLKPSIFKNEFLAVSDPLYTVIFEGLWCAADRDGRLEDRPGKIHMEINPGRGFDTTERSLAWLDEHEFILRYEVDGRKYIQVLKFSEHQKPHQNEKPGLIPAPPSTTKARNAEPIYKEEAQPRLEAEHNQGNKHLALTPDSLFSDSGLLTPDSSTTAAARPAHASPEPEFGEFQAAYPKRAGGNPWPRALKAIHGRLREGHTWRELIDGAARYAAFIRETGKERTEFVMQAATFCGPDKHFLEPWEPPAEVRQPQRQRAKSLAELENEAIARLIGEGKSNVDIACEVGVTAARVEAARGGARAVG